MALIPTRINKDQIITAQWLNRLLDFTKSNEVVGSNYIQVSSLAGKKSIRLNEDAIRKIAASSNSNLYDGFFKVTKTAALQITVAAGIIEVNNDWFAVSETQVAVVASGGIVLEAHYVPAVEDDYGNITTEGYIGSIGYTKYVGSLPTKADNLFQTVICTYTITDSVISEVIQQNHGMVNGALFDALPASDEEELEDAIEEAQAEAYCRTQTGCDEGNDCRSTGAYDISGTSRAEVDTIIANMESEDSQYRDNYTTDLDGGMFVKSCGTFTTLDNTSIDGSTYFARMYVCGCRVDEDDTISEVSECVDANSLCVGTAICTEETIRTSEAFADETTCMNARNARLTQTGLDEICATYDEGADTYYKACGHKDTTECTHSQTGEGEDIVHRWDFTTYPCCCPLVVCPPDIGTDDIVASQGAGLITLTNATECDDLIFAFDNSIGFDYCTECTITWDTPYGKWSKTVGVGEGTASWDDYLAVIGEALVYLQPGEEATCTTIAVDPLDVKISASGDLRIEVSSTGTPV
jgi:hypothetical protein